MDFFHFEMSIRLGQTKKEGWPIGDQSYLVKAKVLEEVCDRKSKAQTKNLKRSFCCFCSLTVAVLGIGDLAVLAYVHVCVGFCVHIP